MNLRQHHPSPNGFAAILTLLGMLLVAVSLPIATKLVQQNQDNRSSARMVIEDNGLKSTPKPKVNTPAPVNPGGHEPECDKDDTKCIDGFINTCNSSYRWVKTSQTCSDPKVTQGVLLCTVVRYGNWSDCVNGKQTRTVTKQPANCSGGVTVESSEQTCTIIPTCTSFIPGDWGSCNKFADGYFQTRTVTGSPAGCTGGNPPNDRQSCTPEKLKEITPAPVNPGGHEPECDKDQTKCIDGFINTCNTSYRWVKTSQSCSDPKVTPGVPLCTKVTYGSWSDCVNGKQTRTVTKQSANCSGGVTVEASEQTCTITPTCTSFTPGEWGACNKFADGYFQVRTLTGIPSGCKNGNPPNNRQSCTPCDSSHCSTCGNPNACSLAGCYWESQVKTCTFKPKVNTPTPSPTSIPCSSSNCSTCSNPNTCRLSGCYWESQVKTCTSKPTTCLSSNCSGCDDASSCSSVGCYWESQVKTCSIKPKVCTSSNCGGCVSASECSSANCYWDNTVKTCITKPKDLPIALCDGAIINTQKCQTPYIFTKCTVSGWETNYCDDMQEEYCVNGDCQKVYTPKKVGDSCVEGGGFSGLLNCPSGLSCYESKCITLDELKAITEAKTTCTGTKLGITVYYDSATACPKGLSCNQITGLCEEPIAAAGTKKTNDFCNSDAECISGTCLAYSNDPSSPKICSKYTSKELAEQHNQQAIEAAAISLLPVGLYAASTVGVSDLSYSAVSKVLSIVTKYPKLASLIKGGFYGLNLLSSMNCLVNPGRPGCQEQAMMSAAIPGTSIVDDVEDFYNWTANEINALVTANTLAKTSANLVESLAKDSTKKAGTILGTAEDGSRLVTVGGITYVDRSMVGVDIYKKYGVEEVTFSEVWNETMLKGKIKEASPVDKSLTGKDALLQSLTGVNPNNTDAFTDFLAVQSNKLAGDYDLPNPNQFDDINSYQKALLDLNPDVEIIAGSEAIKNFDLTHGTSFTDYVNKRSVLGFASIAYPNNIFHVSETLDMATVGHEYLHLKQYQDYFRYRTTFTPAETEFQAYLYDRNISLLDNGLPDYEAGEITEYLIEGMTESSKKTVDELLDLQ